ncbi:DNAH [Mytilus coruscus]|uniref:DNAH n=1 Tax=Mytilus coruscus TaxID=42192 RepID=A0A6J8AQ10_MYTCO|nr:DNAH [Mytilus coruscus]
MSGVEELELNDSRVDFMADYVIKTLKIKPDKFQKMYGVEDTRQMYMDFFEKPECMSLVVGQPAGTLVTSFTWPNKPKAKACYFVKTAREAISKDANLRTALIYGDLSYAPLDQLSAFVDEVLVPLLSNDRNHDHWPQVVSADVTTHSHRLKSDVYVVSGQAKGKTLLPLPVGADKVDAEDDKTDTMDRQLIHAIESVVIEWTHQIRDVLKKDSAQPLLEGLNPTPFVEIEFWKNKSTNLECIYEQLRDPKVRKMAELLERTQSSYFPVFKDIFRDVVAALEEAQDINMYLRPARHHFEDYEQSEFDESGPLMAPMMHTIALIWVHSQYYNTPARIIVLLQEMCNMIINHARSFLDPTELFKGELEETIEKVRKVC